MKYRGKGCCLLASSCKRPFSVLSVFKQHVVQSIQVLKESYKETTAPCAQAQGIVCRGNAVECR